jgi:hypothetical protein
MRKRKRGMLFAWKISAIIAAPIAKSLKLEENRRSIGGQRVKGGQIR